MSRSPRYILLPYRILARRWRVPAFLMIPAGLTLAWAFWQAPDTGPRASIAGLIISLIGLLLFIYTLVAARACIRLDQNRFVMQTPLYPVAFSYQRIERVGSAEFRRLFPPEDAKAVTWRLYHDLWGMTMPTISLTGFPLPRWWLRLWFHPYLFHPTETGIVVPIEDWLSFNRQIETLRSQWRERR